MYLIYIVVINLALFVMMYIDKQRAIKNEWRIKEETLLTLGFIGGGLGGIAGMTLFHHKTRKIKFYIVNIIGIILILFGANIFGDEAVKNLINTFL